MTRIAVDDRQVSVVKWSRRAEAGLDAATLHMLLENRIPAIRVSNFASAEECRSFVEAARHVARDARKHYGYGRPAWYIGMTLIEYRHRPKSDYFADVPGAYADQQRIFARAWDPVQRFMERLQACAQGPVTVAAEPGYGRYFVGIVRNTSHGIEFHADHAPYFARGYLVGSITAQLGLNLYLEMPSSGGETTIYNRWWTPTIHGERCPSASPSFDRAVVADAEAYTLKPAPGDAVLLCNQNFHEVVESPRPDVEDRLTISAHIGRTDDGTLILWS